jgi:4-amino-4-deoxy-L-arabinose transferase-like glycosyltransferase
MQQLIDRLKVLVQDIRFWIVLLFIIRLYGITNPPLDAASTWRQTDVLMIARNFYEIDSNILYPRTDSAGELSGIVGVEFPIFNYLIFLVSKVFGFESWYGRLINLVVTSIGTLYFYKLIRNYFGESPAFYSSITLLVSMWFSYSRITIPDVFAASLCIISLYQGFQYLETGKPSNLFVFVVLGMLGCLAKISAAPILTCLAIPLFINRITLRRKIIISLCSSMILGTVYYWYFVWVPYLNLTYQFGGYFFMGLPINQGFEQITNEWAPALRQFFIAPLKYSGLSVLIISLFILARSKDWVGILTFFLPLLAFLIFVIKSGRWFAVNGYYPLVSVPIFAFLVSIGLSQLKSKRMAIILLLAISVEGIGDQIHVFSVRQPYISLISLESNLNRFTTPNDLIAINSDGSPTPMYCAHRRGWNVSNEQLLDTGFLNSLKSKGCKFIVVLKIFNSNINLELSKVYDSDEYSVYKL